TGAPIGKVAIFSDFIGTQNRDIQMTAAHHRKAVSVVEERSAGVQRHSLLAGVDQIPVFFTGSRSLAKVENAVFGMVDDFAPVRLELGDHFGKADAKIDIGAVLNVLRRAPRDLGVGKLGRHATTPSRKSTSSCCGFCTSTIRLTKMPGVTTCSGLIFPASTTFEA